MKIIGLMYLSVVILLSSCTNRLTIEHGEIRKIADGFIFTEGPASDESGNVYFTDIPNNAIHIYNTDGELALYRDNSGGANGLFFDKMNNLVACEGNNRHISSIDKSGSKTILTSSFEGNRYNKPNDLWIDPKGGIYFSDPAYGVDSSMLEMEHEDVYYILPSRDSVIRVCNDLVRPNGIIGTPDGKKIYITDHFGKMTWEYQVMEDGTLDGKKAFVSMGCDGLTLDALYHVYLTNLDNTSIDVFSPQGDLLLQIPLPERPTNICFGGADHSTLFITAPTSVYAVKMNVRGSR